MRIYQNVHVLLQDEHSEKGHRRGSKSRLSQLRIPKSKPHKTGHAFNMFLIFSYSHFFPCFFPSFPSKNGPNFTWQSTPHRRLGHHPEELGAAQELRAAQHGAAPGAAQGAQGTAQGTAHEQNHHGQGAEPRSRGRSRGRLCQNSYGHRNWVFLAKRWWFFQRQITRGYIMWLLWWWIYIGIYIYRYRDHFLGAHDLELWIIYSW